MLGHIYVRRTVTGPLDDRKLLAEILDDLREIGNIRALQLVRDQGAQGGYVVNDRFLLSCRCS